MYVYVVMVPIVMYSLVQHRSRWLLALWTVAELDLRDHEVQVHSFLMLEDSHMKLQNGMQ